MRGGAGNKHYRDKGEDKDPHGPHKVVKGAEQQAIEVGLKPEPERRMGEGVELMLGDTGFSRPKHGNKLSWEVQFLTPT